MTILSVNNLSKTYGTDVILQDVTFHVNKGDRIGIVGLNGAGKSTLLKILSSEIERSGGEYFISQSTKIGYLKQQDSFDSNSTVINEVSKIFSHFHELEAQIEELTTEISEVSNETSDNTSLIDTLINKLTNLQSLFEQKGGYSYKSEMYGILNSMAFSQDYYDKPISTLSGGEKTRLSLACLLLQKPDVLLLDEPTNHLDIGMLKWLEQYLHNYEGTIILVSHDRYFLDETVNRIFEIEHKTLYSYKGTYSDFATKKRLNREIELRAFTNQAKEIRRQEDLIREFKQRGTEKLAKRAASREKRLAHVEKLEKPAALQDKLKLSFHEKCKSGNECIIARGLSKEYSTKHLFHNIDLDIRRGDRVCIVGDNGIGKTTLFKIIMQQTDKTSGHLKIGHNVMFGYYDQEQELLNYNSTVMDEIHSTYRLYSEGEIRNMLARFLFKNDQVFLPVKSLSGGERARLSLLKLMMSGANVLLLDEPTNHLDIESKEIFEDVLLDFPGAIVVISHDRYFLNKVPTKILELEKNGMKEYLGKFDYYMEKKNEISSGKKHMNTFLQKGVEQIGKNKTTTSFPPSCSTIGEQTIANQFLRKNTNISNVGAYENLTTNQQLSSSESRALSKQIEAENRRIERKKAELEKAIAKYESEINRLESEMIDGKNILNYTLLDDLSNQLAATQAALDDAYTDWLSLEN